MLKIFEIFYKVMKEILPKRKEGKVSWIVELSTKSKKIYKKKKTFKFRQKKRNSFQNSKVQENKKLQPIVFVHKNKNLHIWRIIFC